DLDPEAAANARRSRLEDQRATLELGELAAHSKTKPDPAPAIQLTLDLEEGLEDASPGLLRNAWAMVDHPDGRRVRCEGNLDSAALTVDEGVVDQVVQDQAEVGLIGIDDHGSFRQGGDELLSLHFGQARGPVQG